MKHRGILISFEGGEGAGKTEQARLLVERLKKESRDVISLREPGGTVISEQIRDVVLSVKNKDLTDMTEVFLFQAARAQIYGEVVLPALMAGKIVLMDRTGDSSVVYQGMVRGLGVGLIENLNKISTRNTKPNLTLLLDIDPKKGLARRLNSGKQDRLDLENLDFHHQVRQGYLDLGKADEAGRFRVIDASQSLEEVADEIWKTVSSYLESHPRAE